LDIVGPSLVSSCLQIENVTIGKLYPGMGARQQALNNGDSADLFTPAGRHFSIRASARRRDSVHLPQPIFPIKTDFFVTPAYIYLSKQRRSGSWKISLNTFRCLGRFA
jgi:hypothetical protein